MRAPGHIRPFTPADVPDVVALRPRAFTHSELRGATELRAAIEGIFFEHPWRSHDLPSLVYTDRGGRVAGFLGVVPRPATYCGRTITIAVCTQLMVHPASRGFAGVQLLEAFLGGPQELSLADVANDTSRRLWQALGGSVSTIHSLYWTQPLRPARFRAARTSHGVVGRVRSAALRPVAWALDRTISWPAAAGLTIEPLTPALIAAHQHAILGTLAVRPLYDACSAAWLLERLAAKRGLGTPRGLALRGRGGGIAGWCVYFVNPGGTGEVVQLAAHRGYHARVLDALLHDAWRHGLVALSGRLEAPLLPPLAERRALLDRGGPWMLVHASQPDLLTAVLAGNAFLSRLEGEWWMSF